MRRTGLPNRRELVVCKILKINPHSAIAEMVEYKKTGLIHASEVARKWVRNIREFLKEGQYVVCTVMKADPESVFLSVKRVRPEQSSRKMSEFKKEAKAEKILELIAKGLKKSLDQAYDEVGYTIQEEFGSIPKGFEICLKNPDLFKTRISDKKWVDTITEALKKRETEKTYEARAELKLVCYASDGIEVIKSVLSKVKDGLEIKYISAPKYLLLGSGPNAKEIRTKVEQMGDQIVKEINKQGGDCSFKMVEK